MSYISINPTSASALAYLTGSTSALSKTNGQIASGLAVKDAADNAAYWSIATTMKSSNLSLSSAEDAQAISAATADTAAVGIEAASNIMDQIQSKLIMAKSAGVDKTALNREITQLKDQLQTVTDASSFSGQNWLKTSASESPQVKSMVGSVTSNASGDVAINVIDFDTAKSNLVAEGNASDGLLTKSYSGITKSGAAYDYHLLDANSQTPVSASSKEISLSDSTTSDEIDGMLSALNSMQRGLTDAASNVGSTSSRISSNTDFLQTLQDVTAIGVSRLQDANMEEQSVRRAALSVQQQLQTTGLNIANATMANTLQLFR